MRPHDPPPPKRAARAAARRQLQAGLGWLRGFPVEDAPGPRLAWLTLVDGEAGPGLLACTVDRTRLMRSSHHLTALPRRFPRALPEVVGEVEAWRRNVEAKLALCKAAVHENRPLPPFREMLEHHTALIPGSRLRPRAAAELLTGLRPGTRRLVRALVWLCWEDSAGLLAACRVVRARHAAFAALIERGADNAGLELCLRLCTEAVAAGDRRGEKTGPSAQAASRDGCPPGNRRGEKTGPSAQAASRDGCPPGDVDALLDWFAEPTAWTVPLRSAGGTSQALKQALLRMRNGQPPALRLPTRPGPRYARALGAFCRRLLTWPEADRARGLRALALGLPTAGLRAWAEWWQRLLAVEQEATRLARDARLVPQPERRAAFVAALSELRGTMPPAVRAEDQLRSVERLARNAPPKLTTPLFELLEGLPEIAGRTRVRERCLDHFSWEVDAPERGLAIVTKVIVAVRGLVRAVFPAQPWERATALTCLRLASSLSSLFSDREGPPARQLPAVRRALAALADHKPIADWPVFWTAYAGLRTLHSALHEWEDHGRAVAFFVALRDPEAVSLRPGLQRPLLRLLAHVSPAQAAERFCALAQGLRGRTWTDAEVEALGRMCRSPGLRPLLRAVVEAESLGTLRPALSLYGLLRTVGADPAPPSPETPPTDQAPPAHCPPTLHELWRALAGLDPDAPTRAVRRLLPDPARLEREIAGLRARLPAAEEPRKSAMERRLASLERRLAEPEEVSPRTVGKARRRLRQARRRLGLARWLEAYRSCAAERLREVLGPVLPGEVLEDAELLHLVGCLYELDAGFRKLGLELLRLRTGPRPWDLRDAPANRDFLALCRARGLDLDPWLDGIGGLELLADDGRRLRLALEDDPLAVMRMGAPFETCLSPGDFNFFAAVANAADINKRVLYARDPAGKILGRCLLTLTREGGILTYHPYAHDRRLGFPTLVKRFVRALAEQVGSEPVESGSVDMLVARDWYDDGAVDLVERYAFLREGSRFRAALRSMPDTALLPRLEKELGGPPSSFSLDRLLSLPELLARPALVRALLPCFDSLRLPRFTALKAARLARLAGAGKVSRQLLEEARGGGPLQPEECALVARELVAHGQPHRALHLLRRTRPRGVRTWDDERFPRLEPAARALDALARPSLALRLYKRVLDAGQVGPDLAQRCKRRLHELSVRLVG